MGLSIILTTAVNAITPIILMILLGYFLKCRGFLSKEFLKILRKLKKDTGLEVTARTYKRPPQTPEDEKLLPYFAWQKYIACDVDEPVEEEMFGPELGKRAEKVLKALFPLYEYLYRYSLM